MNGENSTKKVGAKVAKGGSIVLIAKISQGIIGALFTVIVARLLGSKAYGTFGVALSLVSILATVAQFGIPKAITKYISEHAAKKKWGEVRAVLQKSSRYLTISGLGFSIGLIIFAGPIATQFYQNPELTNLFRIGAVALLTWIAFYGFVGIFRGFQKMQNILIINVAYQAVRLISAITFIYVGFRATGAMLGIAAGYGAAIAISFLFLLSRALPSEYSPKSVETSKIPKKILFFSAPVWFSGVAATLLTRLGPMILGKVSTMDQSGYFTAAFSLSIYAIRLPGALGSMLFPSVSESWASGDKQGIRTALKTSMKLIFTMLIPIVAGGIVFSDFVMLLVYGKDFIAGANVLRILLIVFLFWALDSMNNNVLKGIEKPQILAVIRWVSLGIGALSMILLSLNFGAVGAAIGLGLGVIVSASLGVYYSIKLTGISYPFEVFLRPLASAGLMVIFLYSMSQIISNAPLAIIAGIIGLLIYGYTFLRIGGIGKNDIRVLREMSKEQDNPKIFEKIIDFLERYA